MAGQLDSSWGSLFTWPQLSCSCSASFANLFARLSPTSGRSGSFFRLREEKVILNNDFVDNIAFYISLHN
jgi:hypothetical protein